MEPVALTTERLLLRAVGPDDTAAVHEAAQDPEIQRWTTVPSPYLHEHAVDFTGRMAPEGWQHGTSFTLGAFLRHDGGPGDHADPHVAGNGNGGPAPHGGSHPGHGPLVAMTALTVRTAGCLEIGFWSHAAHRRRGYLTEAVRALNHWGFTAAGAERIEWRAEVGNEASRAAALRAGFTMEGTLRSALENKGVRRDCWVGSLLPGDLGLPGTAPYLPAPAH